MGSLAPAAKKRQCKKAAATGEAAALHAQPPYFAGTPATFQNTTDLVLVLDSGETLPLHSSQLTAHSNILSDMLDSPDSSAVKRSATEKYRLPLQGCTLQEATDFVSFAYSKNASAMLTPPAIPGILKVLDMFSMMSLLNLCDEVLASQSNFDGKGAITLWAHDQQRNPGKVLEYLGIGKRYGLKRLTACCERHIAGNFLAIVGGGVNAGSSGGAAPELGSDSLMRIVRALAEAVKGYRLQCSASSSSSREVDMPIDGDGRCPNCLGPITYNLHHRLVRAMLLPSAKTMLGWM